MVLPDVNILVYAFRQDSQDHERHRRWLIDTINNLEPVAVADIICSAFVRVVTNPRIFRVPSSLERAIDFLDELRAHPNSIVVFPSARHWQIFTGLCLTTGARGNLVPDAYYAALAIDTGCEWITMDRDFARFPGLRWRRPL